jgi:hypothetical protein
MRIAPAGLMAIAICYATLASAKAPQAHPRITVTTPQPKAWSTRQPRQPQLLLWWITTMDFVSRSLRWLGACAVCTRGCCFAPTR